MMFSFNFLPSFLFLMDKTKSNLREWRLKVSNVLNNDILWSACTHNLSTKLVTDLHVMNVTKKWHAISTDQKQWSGTKSMWSQRHHVQYVEPLHHTGPDPGFPVGGRGPIWGGGWPPMWALFSENGCENERIWSCRGVCTGTPPIITYVFFGQQWVNLLFYIR